jgi:hypothetical protein
MPEWSSKGIPINDMQPMVSQESLFGKLLDGHLFHQFKSSLSGKIAVVEVPLVLFSPRPLEFAQLTWDAPSCQCIPYEKLWVFVTVSFDEIVSGSFHVLA